MNEFVKIIEMIFGLFAGQRRMFAEKSQAISQEILNQARQVFFLLLIGLGALVSFCLGMNFFIDRLLNQLDQGIFNFTPSVIFLFIFLMICICAILYSTDKENWIKIFKNQSKNTSDINDQNQGANYPGSQIESVIALLILDFIKQREAKPESASTEATKKTE